MRRVALDEGMSVVDFSRALFIDTETTGLAGGTGTVPFLIGMNWVILTIISGSISNYIFKEKKIMAILSGSVLMLIIDFFIEPVAPTLDFWEFKNSIVPFSNYTGWLITGIFTQLVYQFLFKEKELKFSINLYLAIFVFFLFLNFKL